MVSFEPDYRNFQLLQCNIQLNKYRNVIPIQKAVTNQNGKAKIYFDKNYTRATSISPKNIINPNMVCGCIDVETVTLDHFFETQMANQRLDVLKMNVEGAEGLVIDGANHILMNCKPFIVMEFWPEGLKRVGTNPATLLTQLSTMGYAWTPFGESKHKNLAIENVISLAYDVLRNQRRHLQLFLHTN